MSSIKYNELQATVAKILGNGVGDYGYGNAAKVKSKTVTVTTANTTTPWKNLQLDLYAIGTHLYGAAPDEVELPTAFTAAQITASYVQKYVDYVAKVDADRLLLDESSATVVAIAKGSYSKVWSNTLSHEITVKFTNTTARRFYFNAGGTINFTQLLENVDMTSPKNLDWQSMMDTIGTVKFGAYTTSTTGVGDTVELGYYSITSAYQSIYEYVSTDFPENSVRISAKTQGAQNVVFLVEFNDNSRTPDTNNISGKLTSTVEAFYATGSSVSVTRPTATSKIFGGTPYVMVLPPTYDISVVGGQRILNEGGAPVSFAVTTTNVPSSKLLYWGLSSPDGIDGDRFTDRKSFGSFTTVNGKATIIRAARIDGINHGTDQYFQIYITDTPTGEPLATSAAVLLKDGESAPQPVKYTVSPSKPTLIRGEAITFNISASNITASKRLYWKINSELVDANWFTTTKLTGLSSGSVVVGTNGRGTIVLSSTIQDYYTNTKAIFMIDLYEKETDELPVVSSIPVTVTEVRQTRPSYSIALASSTTNTVEEGSTIRFKVTAPDVASGSYLSWKIMTVHSDGTLPESTVNAADFTDGAMEGTVQITGGVGYINKTILQDSITESTASEWFFVKLVDTDTQLDCGTSPLIYISDVLNQTYNVALSDTDVTTLDVINFPTGDSLSGNVKQTDPFYVLFKANNLKLGGAFATYYWSYQPVLGAVSDAKFQNIASHSITTNENGIAKFAIRSTDIAAANGEFTFQIAIREGSVSGKIVALTSPITIEQDNPQYIVTPNKQHIVQGQDISFNISAPGVTGTIPWQISGLTGDAVNWFTDNVLSGTVHITNGVGTLTKTMVASLTPNVSFKVSVWVPNADITTESPAGSSINVAIDRVKVPSYVIKPKASIDGIEQKTVFDRGATIYFDVIGTDVENGSPFYWSIASVSGTLTASDFAENITSGTVNLVTSGTTATATFGLTALNSFKTGITTESFKILGYTNSARTGLPIVISPIVAINDVIEHYSISVIDSAPDSIKSVTRGEQVGFKISTPNVALGTELTWKTSGAVGTADINGSVTGRTTVVVDEANQPAAYVYLSTKAYANAKEVLFTISVNNSRNTAVAGVSPNVQLKNIPTPAYTVQVANMQNDGYKVGDSVVFNITGTNLTSPTTVYWKLVVDTGSITAADFQESAISGAATLTDNGGQYVATVTRNVILNTTNAGIDQFHLELHSVSASGPISAVSKVVTLSRGSIPITITGDTDIKTNKTYSYTISSPAYPKNGNVGYTLASTQDNGTGYLSTLAAGTVAINSGSLRGTLNITVRDMVIDGVTPKFQIRITDELGNVSSSDQITISNKIQQQYTSTPIAAQISRGGSLEYQISTIPVLPKTSINVRLRAVTGSYSTNDGDTVVTVITDTDGMAVASFATTQSTKTASVEPEIVADIYNGGVVVFKGVVSAKIVNAPVSIAIVPDPPKVKAGDSVVFKLTSSPDLSYTGDVQVQSSPGVDLFQDTLPQSVKMVNGVATIPVVIDRTKFLSGSQSSQSFYMTASQPYGGAVNSMPVTVVGDPPVVVPQPTPNPNSEPAIPGNILSYFDKQSWQNNAVMANTWYMGTSRYCYVKLDGTIYSTMGSGAFTVSTSTHDWQVSSVQVAVASSQDASNLNNAAILNTSVLKFKLDYIGVDKAQSNTASITVTTGSNTVANGSFQIMPVIAGNLVINAPSEVYEGQPISITVDASKIVDLNASTLYFDIVPTGAYKPTTLDFGNLTSYGTLNSLISRRVVVDANGNATITLNTLPRSERVNKSFTVNFKKSMNDTATLGTTGVITIKDLNNNCWAVSTNKSSYNEGDTVTVNVAKPSIAVNGTGLDWDNYIPAGQTVYWQMIPTALISATVPLANRNSTNDGSVSGKFVTGAVGTPDSFTFGLDNDKRVSGARSFTLALYRDAALSTPVSNVGAKSSSVVVNDTSLPVTVDSIAITPSTVDEGKTAILAIAASNVSVGDTVYIKVSDFTTNYLTFTSTSATVQYSNNQLSAVVTSSTNNKATINITVSVNADGKVTNVPTVKFTESGGKSATLNINDKSGESYSIALLDANNSPITDILPGKYFKVVMNYANATVDKQLSLVPNAATGVSLVGIVGKTYPTVFKIIPGDLANLSRVIWEGMITIPSVATASSPITWKLSSDSATFDTKMLTVIAYKEQYKITATPIVTYRTNDSTNPAIIDFAIAPYDDSCIAINGDLQWSTITSTSSSSALKSTSGTVHLTNGRGTIRLTEDTSLTVTNAITYKLILRRDTAQLSVSSDSATMQPLVKYTVKPSTLVVSPGTISNVIGTPVVIQDGGQYSVSAPTVVSITAIGGSGGKGGLDDGAATGGIGGVGGKVTGQITLQPGHTLKAYYGTNGGDGKNRNAAPSTAGAAGISSYQSSYNGGLGGASSGLNGGGGSGGAATIVTLDDSAIITAPGGGGGGGAGGPRNGWQSGGDAVTGGSQSNTTGSAGSATLGEVGGAGGGGGNYGAGGNGSAPGSTYGGAGGSAGSSLVSASVINAVTAFNHTSTSASVTVTPYGTVATPADASARTVTFDITPSVTGYNGTIYWEVAYLNADASYISGASNGACSNTGNSTTDITVLLSPANASKTYGTKTKIGIKLYADSARTKPLTISNTDYWVTINVPVK